MKDSIITSICKRPPRQSLHSKYIFFLYRCAHLLNREKVNAKITAKGQERGGVPHHGLGQKRATRKEAGEKKKPIKLQNRKAKPQSCWMRNPPHGNTKAQQMKEKTTYFCRYNHSPSALQVNLITRLWEICFFFFFLPNCFDSWKNERLGRDLEFYIYGYNSTTIKRNKKKPWN